MKIAYDIVTAAIAATMAGNEFAIAAFIHPQLHQFDDKAHAKIASRLASPLGKTMPLWYGIALALILGAVFEHRPSLSGPGLLITSAAILWGATIVFSITMLVPINNRIAYLNPEHPYEGWLSDRLRWDRLHRIRVVLLVTAVLLLLAGLLQAR
jgi:Domain of unknown function (DUF1772)